MVLPAAKTETLAGALVVVDPPRDGWYSRCVSQLWMVICVLWMWWPWLGNYKLGCDGREIVNWLCPHAPVHKHYSQPNAYAHTSHPLLPLPHHPGCPRNTTTTVIFSPRHPLCPVTTYCLLSYGHTNNELWRYFRDCSLSFIN